MSEFEEQLSRASSGEALAQFNLGWMYDKGDGVEQDETEAVRWYRLAASQGYAGAQCNLGVMYNEGRVVEQDDGEAACWYRLAASQGNDVAQFNLGWMYAEGRGVEQDETEAVRWYRLAAGQNFVKAQFYLGVMYAQGRGVEQDETEAVRWYRLAAGQNFVNAQCNLGSCYEMGSGVAQDHSEAVRWYRLAAEQGDYIAKLALEDLKDEGADSRWCAVEDLVEGMTVRMPEGVGRISKIDEPYFWVQWTEPNELKERGWAKKRYSIESPDLDHVEVLPDLDHVEVLSAAPSDLSTENDLSGYIDKFLKQPKSDEPKSDELDWPWPATEAPEGVGGGVQFEHEASALKLMGYTVGKSQGKPPKARKDFLDAFFRNSLPGWVEKHFPDEYGMPGSEQRLHKMANVLAANTRNFKRNDRETYRFAISDWEEDLAHLKRTYYNGAPFFHFPWPPIEPR